MLLALAFAGGARAQYATQTFEAWPDTGNLWTNQSVGGWTIRDAQVRTAAAGYGTPIDTRAAWLNDFDATSNTWVQSPLLAEGAAGITFQARRNLGAAGDQFFQLQSSPDGTNWATTITFDRINDDWTPYSATIDLLNPAYLRIVKTGDQNTNQLLGLDDIAIEPSPGVRLSGITHMPIPPLPNSAVHITASAEPATAVSNVVMQAFYRLGTNGIFNATAMTNGAGFAYQTTTPIPPGYTGVVQYYVQCTHEGFGQSPLFLPDAGSAGPLSYDTGKPFLNMALRQLTPSSHRTPLIVSEIMYNPGPNTVTSSLTFVEIFNTEPVAQNLGGYSLAGDVAYTFPLGTILAPRAFAVVAADPAAAQAQYGISGVYGPMTGGLPNGGGTLRLRNREGATLLEIDYDDAAPWPVAPDGSGHSLVLALPDFGEGEPEAWRASRLKSGSPGNADPVLNAPLDAVVINEFLAHTDLPDIDYIELFNTATQSVDISGCTLSDTFDTNKFTIPPATILPPLGFIVFDQATLGFSLSSHGDEIVFSAPGDGRVISAIRFGAQINGVPSGRVPDGAADLATLAAKTPGASNNPAGLRPESVVINEIMYHPLSGNDDDEFIELRNTGTNAADVGFWRLNDGVTFTIPPGTTIPAGGHLVIARNLTNLLARHPQLNLANTVGNYDGQLADGGERLALSRPDDLALPDQDFVPVDEVTYRDGPDWGRWTDGGGSSLELIDARADNRLAMNWAGSDESTKAPWTVINAVESMDNGVGLPDELRTYLVQDGECLLDNVGVAAVGGSSYLSETFEGGIGAWQPAGNHTRSSLATTEGQASAQSLHLRASGPGLEGTWNDGSWEEAFWNRVSVPLAPGLPAAGQVRIQAGARWLAGSPNLVMVIRGYWAEAAVTLTVPTNLGTPGLPNSRARANTGPAIGEVTHAPVLPPATQPVVVSARIHDPDGVGATLLYRVDPNTNYSALAMNDAGTGGDARAGDGRFSATIPGQAAGLHAAFRIRAADLAPAPQTNTFPIPPPTGAPENEGVIQFGQALPPGILGAYYMWISDANVARWQNINAAIPGNPSKYSNEPIDFTFVSGNDRVIYNAGGRFRGLWRGYGSPVNSGAYAIDLPASESFLGDSELSIDQPGQTGGDATRQKELFAYGAARRIGLPSSQIRPVRVFVNATDRGIHNDLQTPGNDFVQSWYGDENPNIYKMYGWIGDPLNVYTDAVGNAKDSRYRWNLKQRRRSNPEDDFAPVFNIARAAAVTNDAVYTARMDALIDLRTWVGYFAMSGALASWDTYGWQNAHNGYFYIPHDRGAGIFIYDLDWSMEGAQSLYPYTKWPVPYRMLNLPLFRRTYLAMFKEMANGPMTASEAGGVFDPWYLAYIGSGTGVQSPAGLKAWVASYRNTLLNAVAPYNVPFAITTSGGANFSTTNTIVTLAGTAPVDVDTIRINGVRNVLTFPTVTNWSLRVGLPQGTNALLVTAHDWRGDVLASNTITVTATTPAPSPAGQLVISEIMYHAPGGDSDDYVEIFNRSTNATFDLRGWRLNGADLTFNGGSLLGPRQFAILAASRPAYQHTYGNAEMIIGKFDGLLDNGGETLSLQMPAGSNTWTTVDAVTYDDDLPWPAAADGSGASLQVIDLDQSNDHPGNWRAASAPAPAWQFKSYTGTMANSSPIQFASARVYFLLQSAGTVLVDRVCLVTGTVAESGANIIANGDFETALTGPWSPIGNHATSTLTTNNAFSGTNALAIVATGPGGFSATGLVSQATNLFSYANRTVTFSYWYLQNPAVAGLSAVVTHSTLSNSHTITPLTPILLSPGTNNSVATALPTLPDLWINEIMPSNVTAWADNVGDFDPWIELYNAGTATVSLAAVRLSNSHAAPGRWAFPTGSVLAAGARLLVWADAETNETAGANLHASFRLHPATGAVVLAYAHTNEFLILDALDYNQVGANFSYGFYPEGDHQSRQVFHTPTPGSANLPGSIPVTVVINEWMADNKSTLRDPTDLQYDDWFELYNPSAVPVNLGGHFLTDNLAQTNKFTIPGGVVIPAGGFLLVWADDAANLNGPGVNLHVNFKLSDNGESIGLFRPDGTIMDAVTFGAQSGDRSEGSWPNGAAAVYVMAPPTPGSSNQVLLVTSLPPSAPGSFALNWLSQSGRVYTISGATNLVATNWITLGIVTAASPSTTFTDTNSAAFLRRFYRLQRAN